MKLYVYDTERLEDELDDFTSATGVEHVRLGKEWSESNKVAHCSPESFLLAAKLVGSDQDSGLFADSLTDMCEYPRDEYARKNPGKKIAYAMVDASMAPIVRCLKEAPFHWIGTFREKDEKGNRDGEEVVIGKMGKASKDMQYVARVKVHCQRAGKRTGGSCEIEIRDQRGLKEAPPVTFVDPKVADLAPLVARYKVGSDKRLRAHFFGREATGKTGCALRMWIALFARLKGGE